MDTGGLSDYLGAGRAGQWVQGRDVSVVNKRNYSGWEATVEETELGPGQLLLAITLLAPAMAVLSAEDSSEALGLGLQVRPPWVPCRP